MSRRIQFTDDAARDLQELLDYVARHDSPDKADDLQDRLEQTVAGLTRFPNKGNHPKEMLELGIRDFREVRFKPYRIIYHILEDVILVLIVADGRRDMRTLLQRRLLEA